MRKSLVIIYGGMVNKKQYGKPLLTKFDQNRSDFLANAKLKICCTKIQLIDISDKIIEIYN